MSSAVTPPTAAKRPVVTHHHGIELVDDYAWLRDANWQAVMEDPAVLDPEIRAHLEGENAYTASVMADTEPLQAELFAEMKARIKEDDNSVPTPDGPWAYYTSTITGGQYSRLCRKPRDGGVETILLDGNAEAAGKAYWRLGASSHSNDHRYLAYALDEKGSELFTIRVRDLETGKDLPDAIAGTRGAIVWTADSRTFFYVRVDDQQRPRFIHRHTLGDTSGADPLVYTEPDPGFFVGVGETQSRKLIVITSNDHQTTEVQLIDAHSPAAPPRLVAARSAGHEYSVDHIDSPDGGTLAILTNSGEAEDFRICTAPVATPGPEHWTELLAHKPGRLILDMGVLKRHMIRLEREDGLPRIVVRRLADGAEHAIAFAEEAYSLGYSSGYEYDTNAIRFTYSSMTTPSETYDYDVETRSRTLRKRQEVPSGHDPKAYVTRRLFAKAADGELVPVTLLYRASTPLDGSAPVFLYGYGSYGITIPSAFSIANLSLADRGFIYAVAHVRGGKDKGYRWYKAGKHLHKMNTFTDFIAAGEFLVSQGLTRRGNIVANGGSAGGMLMGAVANMAPDLFLGIIADVPFVDVLNTMLDKDLPLTPPEWPEWGNPIESAQDFAIIRSYSPYDNVERKAYPHLLAFAGLTDPRVTYWEPAKWIAKLRERRTNANLLILKTNMGAGHGGASGRFERLKEVAFDYAFALKVAGKAGV